MNNFKALLSGPDTEAKCRGIVYRADVQHCKTERGVMFSVRLNKMKRMSCPGCERCAYLEDDLGEIDPVHWPVIGIEKAEHGRLYTIDIVNISTDWESGHADAWDLKLIPVSIKEKP